MALVASPQMRRQTPKDSRMSKEVSIVYMVEKEERIVAGKAGV